MNSSKKLIATAAFTGLLVSGAGHSAMAGDVPFQATMKPFHGISFDLGTNRAIGYYLVGEGMCELVLSLVEPPAWDGIPALTATRFEVAIPAGKTRRFASAENKILEFACRADVQTMTVTAVDMVAAESGPAD